jgi:hypothetical protein
MGVLRLLPPNHPRWALPCLTPEPVAEVQPAVIQGDEDVGDQGRDLGGGIINNKTDV